MPLHISGADQDSLRMAVSLVAELHTHWERVNTLRNSNPQALRP